MSTFVEVTSDRLLATLREIGAKITAKGGCCEEKIEGQEIVFSIALPPQINPLGTQQPPQPDNRTEYIVVKVYTSIAKGAESARGCGEDAIRIVTGSISTGEFKPISESQTIKRTAPNDVADREGAFLERLTEALRKAYSTARSTLLCECGHHMAKRTNRAKGTKFWGCTTYPACTKTRKI